MLFILLLVIPVSHAQVCPSNITLCETEYINRIIKPMGITYVPVEKLKSVIRYYNFRTVKIRGRNKRERRKFRKLYHKNYKLFSHSKELDYMEHVCSINYDKLDVSRLSYKYKKTQALIYNYKSAYNFVKLTIIFVLILCCIIVSLY